MTRATIVGITILITSIASCRPRANDSAESRLASTSVPTPSSSRCNSDTGLVYTDVTKPAETGDLSGFEIKLSAGPEGWSGSAREAAGEFGSWIDLADVRVDSALKSLDFAIPNGPDSSRFRGAFSCDSLWGSLRAFRTTGWDSITFRRVR